MRRNKELEQIKLFVANLMNTEQSNHSKLVNDLQKVAGKTKEFDEMLKVLTQIYEAKADILEKIYNEILKL